VTGYKGREIMKIKNYMWQVPIFLVLVNLVDFIIDGKADILGNSVLFLAGMYYYKKFM